jgi:hypothetical protein
MILQTLSSLISHRVSVNLEALFPPVPVQPAKQLLQTIRLGGAPIQQVFEERTNTLRQQGTMFQSHGVSESQIPETEFVHKKSMDQIRIPEQMIQTTNSPLDFTSKTNAQHLETVSSFSPLTGEYGSLRNSAHSAFLYVRLQGMRQLAKVISLIADTTGNSNSFTPKNQYIQHPKLKTQNLTSEDKSCLFDYQDLLELAGGKISNVFGPEYTEIDSYRRCVRLPMEPYLLVSRVTKLVGKLGEFKPSTITTEYDIPNNAWYTTDGQIPWAVAVESGQCDLMLISYLR